MSCASATQTLAWAAATTSGRASESRKAVARLIGKERSVGSSGANFSFIWVASGDASVGDRLPGAVSGAEGGIGKAGGRSRTPRFARNSAAERGSGIDDVDRRAIGILSGLADSRVVGGGGRSRPCSLTNRSMEGDTDDGGKGASPLPPRPAPDSTVGGTVVAGDDSGWAAHGTGSSQANSKAMARIDGQAVLFFMTNLTPFRGSPIRSAAWAIRAEVD